MVDLWDTDKPATGVNGTGPDNYEEALFAERLQQVVNSHDTSTPLFLYYAPHIVHSPYEPTSFKVSCIIIVLIWKYERAQPPYFSAPV